MGKRELMLGITVIWMAFMAIPLAEGATKTWTGATNQAWNVASNWDPAGVPDQYDTVYIPDTANDPVIYTSGYAHSVQINDSAILTIDGGTLSTIYLTINSTAYFDISNNETVVYLGFLYNYGTVYAGTVYTPEIYLNGSLYSYNTIQAGHSTIYFTGSGDRYIRSNSHLYNVVVNNSGLTLKPTYSNGLYLEGNLTIENGRYDLNNRRTVIEQNLQIYDELLMNNEFDELVVLVDVNVYDGGYMHGDNGTLYINDDFIVFSGGQVRFYGWHDLVFNGSIYTIIKVQSNSSYFHNITVNMSSGLVSIYNYIHVNNTFIVEDGYVYGYNLNFTATDMIVKKDRFGMYSSNEMSISDDLIIYNNAEFLIGLTTMEGGTLHVMDDIYLYGDLTFYRGNITLGSDLIIYNTGNLTFNEGGNITGNEDQTWFVIYGHLYVDSNATTTKARVYYIYTGGEIWVEDDRNPVFGVFYIFREFGGEFHEGKSVVKAIEPYYTYLDPDLTYWGIVVETECRISYGTSDTLYINGFLAIEGGVFNTYGYNVQVNDSGAYERNGKYYHGFSNFGGSLRIYEYDDVFTVKSDIYWGNGSTAMVSLGEIYCYGDWIFDTGSQVNLTGNNTVYFGATGIVYYHIWVNSTQSSFQDVYLKRGSIVGTDTHLNGTASMVVDGNMTISGYASDFHVGSSTLTVWGDLIVSKGDLYMTYAGQIQVHGDLETHYDDSILFADTGSIYLGSNLTNSGGGMLIVGGDMIIDGQLFFEGTGGNVSVSGWTYITENGIIEIRGSAGNLSTGDLRINGSTGNKGEFLIWSSSTTITTGRLIFSGYLNVSDDSSPRILVSEDFNWFGYGEFNAGRSEVRLVGTGYQVLEDDFNYWGLVIDKPSGEVYPEGDIVADAYFAIANGTFNVTGITVTVNIAYQNGYSSSTFPAQLYGFIVDENGDLEMWGGNIITYRSFYYASSYGNITAGVITVYLYWYFWTNADITLTGTNIVRFVGSSNTYIFQYSPNGIFNDVNISKTSTLWISGAYNPYPVKISGDLNISNSDVNDNLNITDAGLIVDGDVNIYTGTLSLSSGADVSVGGDIEMASDARILMSGGSLSVTRHLTVDGHGFDVSGSGGSVEIDDYLFVNSNLTIDQNDGNSFILHAYAIQVNGTGNLSVLSNDTVISTDFDVGYFGVIYVGDDNTPKFIVGDDWYKYSGSFEEGHSEVWLVGNNPFQIFNDDLWILVVNKTAGVTKVYANNLLVRSCLFIIQGHFHTNGKNLSIGSEGNGFNYNGTDYVGFVNYGGVLEMSLASDILYVNGPVKWGPGSSFTGDNGVIYCDGSWEFMSGSQANLTGDNKVVFIGTNYEMYPFWAPIYCNSTGSSFNRVVINRKPFYGVFTSELSQEPVVVKDWLLVQRGAFDVYRSEIVVGNRITVESTFQIETSNYYPEKSKVTVNGNIYVEDTGTFIYYINSDKNYVDCGNITINGSLFMYYAGGYLNLSSNIYVRGTMDISTSYNVVINVGWIYIYTGGSIDIETYNARINSRYIYIYPNAYLNLTDNATIIISERIFLYGIFNASGTHADIWVGYKWRGYSGSVFNPGNSIVTFFNTTYVTTIYYTSTFYDIVVNDSAYVVLESVDMICHNLTLKDGILNLQKNVTATGDFAIYGHLIIGKNIILDVEGDIHWYSGSTENIINGTIIAHGDFIVDPSASVSLSDANILKFVGGSKNLIVNEIISFNEVLVETYGWLYTYLSTENITVMGNLTINSSDYGMSIQNTHLVVYGDLNVDGGKLLVTYSGNATILGNTYCHEGTLIQVYNDFVTSNLTVDGTLDIAGDGAEVWVHGDLYIPGSEVLFQEDYQYMKVEGDLWINSTGYVNMTGGIETLEIMGKLYDYGVLNVTNDNATLKVHGSLHVMIGGTFTCGNAEPEIYLWGSFYASSSSINLFHSTIYAVGSNLQSFSSALTYWGIVINKTDSYLQFSGDSDKAYVSSFFFIMNGSYYLFSNLTVNSSGTGYLHEGVNYRGFANYGGFIEIFNDWCTLDVNGPVYWGNGSSEDINKGEIDVSGMWKVDYGADVTLDGGTVIFDGLSHGYIILNADTYFYDVRMMKDDIFFRTYLGGNKPMHVNGTLIVGENNVFEANPNTLIANDVYVYDGSYLNVSLPYSQMILSGDLVLNDTATFYMGNDTTARMMNLIGTGTVRLSMQTELYVHKDLYLTSGSSFVPGASTVIMDSTNSPAKLAIFGSFFNMIINKSSSVVNMQRPLYVGNDLLILNGELSTGGYDIYLYGDYYCSPDAIASHSSGSQMRIIGGRTQYIQTGGSDPDHDFYDLVVYGGGTQAIFQNFSVRVSHNLTVNENNIFRFEASGYTLHLGNDGTLNEGSFYVEAETAPIEVVFFIGTTFWNNGTLWFWGNSNDDYVRLRSSEDGFQWHLVDKTGANNIPMCYHVKVSDSDASGGNTIYAGQGFNADLGNNDNWVFSYFVTIDLQGLDGHFVNLTVKQYGSSVKKNGTTQIFTWADEGSTATLQDSYIVAADKQRYYSSDTTSWTVNDNISASVEFHRQWKPYVILNNTDSTHKVRAYYVFTDVMVTTSNEYGTWSGWVDNGTYLWFSKNTTGSPVRHTNEDFNTTPWKPLISAFTKTVYYEENSIPELLNGTMEPASGNTTTWFNFTVIYRDANNDPPEFVYVNIDGTNYTMSKVNATDNDYTDGVKYYYRTRLSGGDHDYYFIASDTYDTNQTAVRSTGTIIPEFDLIIVVVGTAIVGIALIWRRRRIR